MIVIIEERQPVASAYAALFGREGVAVLAQTPAEFAEWAASAPDVELEAIEAILLGGAADRQQLAQSIRRADRRHRREVAGRDAGAVRRRRRRRGAQARSIPSASSATA